MTQLLCILRDNEGTYAGGLIRRNKTNGSIKSYLSLVVVACKMKRFSLILSLLFYDDDDASNGIGRVSAKLERAS